MPQLPKKEIEPETIKSDNKSIPKALPEKDRRRPSATPLRLKEKDVKGLELPATQQPNKKENTLNYPPLLKDIEVPGND